ncbi:MAG: hypothetical protein PUJ51_12305, partial [Clostridiales bacterium]|uniref:hypothetical protein n=1 Tax=Terrisporobacter sp. TaxID=1965305 RepID=UPI002A58EA8B
CPQDIINLSPGPIFLFPKIIFFMLLLTIVPSFASSSELNVVFKSLISLLLIFLSGDGKHPI